MVLIYNDDTVIFTDKLVICHSLCVQTFMACLYGEREVVNQASSACVVYHKQYKETTSADIQPSSHLYGRLHEDSSMHCDITSLFRMLD